MKLQQLRYVAEIVKHGNHLSAAAEALNTSQPGVSRQVQLLEQELGFEIFQRTRNRIIGVTEPGQHVLVIAQRVCTDIAALRTLKSDMLSGNSGVLTVGTTHTQARYVLPRVIESFVRQYPDVRLVLKQGDPEDICATVDMGEADIAIGTETVRGFPNLVKLPCFTLERSVIAPKGHPILSEPELTLEVVARYPLITYDDAFTGRGLINKAFLGRGLKPNVVLSAIDSDVIKKYVEMDLGIGILARMAYDPAEDRRLGMVDASHLFESSMTRIGLRKRSWLRAYVYAFIEGFAPHLSRPMVEMALAGGGSDPGL